MNYSIKEYGFGNKYIVTIQDSTNVQDELNILFEKKFNKKGVKNFLEESFGHDKILSKIEPNVNSYYEHFLQENPAPKWVKLDLQSKM
jgi:hypothetical protein